MMDTVKRRRSSLTIYKRLFLGFILLSLPLLIVIAVFLTRIDAIVHIGERINIVNALPSTLDTELYDARETLNDWILTGDDTLKMQFAHIWSGIFQTKRQWDDLVDGVGEEHILDLWNKVRPMYEPFHAAQLAVLNMPRNARTLPTLIQSAQKIKPMGDHIMDIIDGPRSPVTGTRSGGIYDLLYYKVDSEVRAINNQLVVLRYFAYGLLTLAILLSLIIPFITARSIRRSLDKSIEIAEKIAQGERSVNIETTSDDEVGKLLATLKKMQDAIKENEAKIRANEEEARQLSAQMVRSSNKFSAHSSRVAAGDLKQRLMLSPEDVMQDLGRDLNLMTDGLADITKKITEASNHIVTMIDQIMPAANKESETIVSQAAVINQISGSLEQIDQSSKQTMIRAQALREAAKATYQQGKLGTESIKQSIAGIKDSEEKVRMIAQTILNLSNHMQQIGEITAAVNTLSQQSKMLALNASIEASKAGEAGKGFAAVANEVKNLAEQSEQATVQVQKILEDIRHATEKAVVVTEDGTKTLDAGAKLVDKAGEVIQTLTKMIDEAAVSSQQIEAAITQEGVGIEQIVTAMNEINRATSSFANGIKETTSFIHKLAKIAKQLKEAVNIYKT